jgi:hypothetical protein
MGHDLLWAISVLVAILAAPACALGAWVLEQTAEELMGDARRRSHAPQSSPPLFDLGHVPEGAHNGSARAAAADECVADKTTMRARRQPSET